MAVCVIHLHHADAKPAGRLPEPRRQLFSREHRGPVAEVASRWADPEDVGQGLAGELVGDRAGLPIDEAGAGGGMGGGDRERAVVGPQDHRGPFTLQLLDGSGRRLAAVDVAREQADLPAGHAATLVDLVDGDLDPVQLLPGQARGGAAQGQHQAEDEGAWSR